MNNSKLIEILRAFDSQEFHRLGLFLHSPYFQEGGIGEEEGRLYELIVDHLKDETKGTLDKDIVFQKLFPNTDFVKGKLEKKMSALLKQVQRFIIQEQSTQNRTEFKDLVHLSRFYRQKELTRLYKITFASLQKTQAKIVQRDKEFYYNEFLLYREITEYKSLQNNRSEDLGLPDTLKSLDVFYLASKLEYAYGLLSLKEFQIPIDAKDSMELLFSVSKFIGNNNFLDVPLVRVYHKAISLLQNTDDRDTFIELRRLLEENREQLPYIDLKALKALCRNFCIHQFNKGNKDYLELAYVIYKEDLEQGLMYYNNGLVPGALRNIAAIGLKQKKYEWVYQFLQDHKNRIIGTENPEQVYRFNMAHYYFELGDYGTTLQYLSDHYEDLYYRIAAKRLELKVYFEQDSVLLQPKIDAFKIFIHRWSQKKLPHTHREANNNFINALRQIITPGIRFNEKRVERVIKKIEEQEVTTEKDWLLEKLEMHIGKRPRDKK